VHWSNLKKTRCKRKVRYYWPFCEDHSRLAKKYCVAVLLIPLVITVAGNFLSGYIFSKEFRPVGSTNSSKDKKTLNFRVQAESGEPVVGVSVHLSFTGVESNPTDVDGNASVVLPQDISSSHAVFIEIRGENNAPTRWPVISPMNGYVILPGRVSDLGIQVIVSQPLGTVLEGLLLGSGEGTMARDGLSDENLLRISKELSLTPEDVMVAVKAVSHSDHARRGLLAMAEGDYDQASMLFDKALSGQDIHWDSLEGERGTLQILRAVSLSRLGRLAEAEEALSLSVDNDSIEDRILLIRGSIRLKERKWNSAEKDFLRVVENNLATCHIRLGSREEFPEGDPLTQAWAGLHGVYLAHFESGTFGAARHVFDSVVDTKVRCLPASSKSIEHAIFDAHNLAVVFTNRGDYQAAEELLKLSANLLVRAQFSEANLDHIKSHLEGIREIYRSLGRTRDAGRLAVLLERLEGVR